MNDSLIESIIMLTTTLSVKLLDGEYLDKKRLCEESITTLSKLTGSKINIFAQKSTDKKRPLSIYHLHEKHLIAEAESLLELLSLEELKKKGGTPLYRDCPASPGWEGALIFPLGGHPQLFYIITGNKKRLKSFSKIELTALSNAGRLIYNSLKKTKEDKVNSINYRLLFNRMLDGVALLDQENYIIVEANHSFTELMGFDRNPAGISLIKCLKSDRERWQRSLNKAVTEKRIISFEDYSPQTDCYLEYTFHPPIAGRMAIVIKDITEKRIVKNLLINNRTRIHQAQKMDTIGRMAAGAAHDFNNVLTTVMGYSELLLDEKLEQSVQDFIKEIFDASKRGSFLTRQLLVLSRKQIVKPEIVSLNEIISSMEKMLARVTGSDISLDCLLSPTICRIEADIGQIEQILINLLFNACDAMPQGGTIKIETIDKNSSEGRYAQLILTDNGLGMSEEIKSRIFEPYFTTKKRAGNNGLGLTTTAAIVRQYNGRIEVESSPGKGTTIELSFPEAKIAEESGFTEPIESLILIEDSPQARKVIKTGLDRAGYNIFTAESLEETMEIMKKSKEKISLIITDVVMPEMDGKRLTDMVKKEYPNLKILFISGYEQDIILNYGIDPEESEILLKPFTIRELNKKIRSILDR